MSEIKPGDVVLTKSCRMVRVLASRDDEAAVMRDYRGRVAVRSVDTDRLSYHSEHELTLVQPPATLQEPKQKWGPFFNPCEKCVTQTHCAHHDRCLAACVPENLRASAWSPLPESERPDYETLDPGIRDVVRMLNDHGFDTTDSGDGLSKPADWYPSACALPFPNVAMKSTAEWMIADADRAKALLGENWTVEASYSALDRKVFLLARTLDDLERDAPTSAPR